MSTENSYRKQMEIRWSDLDPNFHLRHSAYYDLGAYSRISFLTENGLTPTLMQELKIGPVLLREECVFKKEIHFSDRVSVNLLLQKKSSDGKRWTLIHEVFTHSDILSAVITAEGAWLDTLNRKLIAPSPFILQIFQKMPLHPDYQHTAK